jgi:hypothetical protein
VEISENGPGILGVKFKNKIKLHMVLYKAILNLLLKSLTPKGPRPFFSKNAPNLPFLAQDAQMIFFSIFLHFQPQDLALDYWENMCKKFHDN